MYVFRDKSERCDYWVSLQAPDRDADPDDGSVVWMPWDSDGSASFGPTLWEAMGGPPVAPGEIIEVDMKFAWSNKQDQVVDTSES